MLKFVFCLSFCVWISACTWVKPSEESHSVALVSADEVANCRKLGSTDVGSLAKVGPVPRNDQKLKTELITLAKNEAVIMNGDTIVAESGLREGKQTFGVYRCR